MLRRSMSTTCVLSSSLFVGKISQRPSNVWSGSAISFPSTKIFRRLRKARIRSPSWRKARPRAAIGSSLLRSAELFDDLPKIDMVEDEEVLVLSPSSPSSSSSSEESDVSEESDPDSEEEEEEEEAAAEAAARTGRGRFFFLSFCKRRSCFFFVVFIDEVVVVTPKKFKLDGIFVAFCVAAEEDIEVAAALNFRICAPYFL